MAIIVFDKQPSQLLSFQKVSGPESLGWVSSDTVWARKVTLKRKVKRSKGKKKKEESQSHALASA